MDNRIKLLVFSIVFIGFVFMLIFGLSKIKVDDFKKAAIMFVVDASASNQSNLNSQKMLIRQLCSMLDPEDHIKIIRVSQDAYIIYEGSAQSGSEIRKSLDKFTKLDPEEYGTAYGLGIKKAFNYLENLKQDGYVNGVVVIGDLENEGSTEKQINWDKLPQDVSLLKQKLGTLSMMFLYASPEKLDLVKEKLTPVLGETNLIIGNEIASNKVLRRFLNAIGR